MGDHHAGDAGNWDSGKEKQCWRWGGDREQQAHEHGCRQAIRPEEVVKRCGEKTPARENYSESSSFSCLLIISIGGFRI